MGTREKIGYLENATGDIKGINGQSAGDEHQKAFLFHKTEPAQYMATLTNSKATIDCCFRVCLNCCCGVCQGCHALCRFCFLSRVQRTNGWKQAAATASRGKPW